MNSKAQLTVDIITKVAERKITIVNTAKLLSKSRRTIERYLQQYHKVGIQFIVHRNTSKAPVNKTPDSLKRQVQAFGESEYLIYDLDVQDRAEPAKTSPEVNKLSMNIIARDWTPPQVVLV